MDPLAEHHHIDLGHPVLLASGIDSRVHVAEHSASVRLVDSPGTARARLLVVILHRQEFSWVGTEEKTCRDDVTLVEDTVTSFLQTALDNLEIVGLLQAGREDDGDDGDVCGSQALLRDLRYG